METKSISRRQFVQGTGALIVGFNFFGPISGALTAEPIAPFDSVPDPTSLDSWLMVHQDGNVTVFTSKVELGTGVITALSQIVAEELDVPFSRIQMETGDTNETIDQASTVASRTIERGGPQLRQAAAGGAWNF
jgi:nicotinate dehydrogenase subunit B